MFASDLTFIKNLLLKLTEQNVSLVDEVDPVNAIIAQMTKVQSLLESRGSHLDDVTSVIGGLI